MRLTLTVITWCLLFAYPAIVYFGLRTLHPAWLGGFFLAVAALRFIVNLACGETKSIPFLLSLVLALAGLHALLAGTDDGLLYYPVAANVTLLAAFSASLFQAQSVIERIARISDPDLPPVAVSYTRKVTVAWCIFFLVNGSIALYTVLAASRETWALYNGLISYLLVGLMFGGEFLIRRRVRRAIDG